MDFQYLTFLVPVYGAFVVLLCCAGCCQRRLNQRVSSLEQRYSLLEQAHEQRITILPAPAPVAPPAPAPVLMPLPANRMPPMQPMYYPTPGMYPTRGAYQPPTPSAPSQDPVVVYQSGPKHI